MSCTNPPEKPNSKFKRRAAVIDIFPNSATGIRVVDALILEQSDNWAVSRSYMMLETIGSVSHNPVVSLPTLTT
ncbi:transposase [Phenylobacterium parvum]|uniref:Transposase n=1 Tax=Phenylobacterium parvum TaxID=2201350 RepID=A0A2Z3HXE3_9CAUL|nr:hypothetical protein HYN04_09265 [Phenylobacterium parvum]MCA3643171.1 transposase [Methylobacterium sp.]